MWVGHNAPLQAAPIATPVVDAARGDNLLTHAPHTLQQVIADDWTRPYPRERAAFPSPSTRLHKVWPTVGRIDSAWGDRHLVCTCPPVEAYASQT